MTSDTTTPTGLAALRVPFPAHQISQRPADRLGKVMLSYVGHAALTDRLLDADPMWTWEPFATGPDGLPLLDQLGGLWIRLTVCGVTRIGYGDAQGKEGPNAIKECIGDALRNAAMRFGAALDLWHKGDLHADEGSPKTPRVGKLGDGAGQPANGGRDMSPKARAQRIMTGISAGDATGAALAMSGWEQELVDAVWQHLSEEASAALVAAWPKPAEERA